jgi:hypothetical protein
MMANLKNSNFVNSDTKIQISEGGDVTINGCSFDGSNTVFNSAQPHILPKKSSLLSWLRDVTVAIPGMVFSYLTKQ